MIFTCLKPLTEEVDGFHFCVKIVIILEMEMIVNHVQTIYHKLSIYLKIKMNKTILINTNSI